MHLSGIASQVYAHQNDVSSVLSTHPLADFHSMSSNPRFCASCRYGNLEVDHVVKRQSCCVHKLGQSERNVPSLTSEQVYIYSLLNRLETRHKMNTTSTVSP